MGIMSKILGGGGSRSVDDYVELDTDDFADAHAETGTQVHFAEIADQSDVIPIKDAVYDGDFVVADITRHSTSDRTIEHVYDELRQVVEEVDGDIVQKGDDQIIVTPTGVKVSRQKL
ncbi:cell division protein SepF [Halorubrum sp. RMP-47]|jgi:SepF-like predicted cell division protein (DUF552 family)|uniref:Cell division protein SepF n=1 Tax=Halorubrum miltondacostae TaxID=3076378 RepID=A0ABD5M2Y5_9EURY|nr:cell division protein SepF [uncultured Halorubrum sp.]